MSYLPIKKRCIRCRHYLREDSTCENPKCIRYIQKEDTTEFAKDAAEEDNAAGLHLAEIDIKS